MSKIKLTKNGLRDEQKHLNQLNRYLPTLKLKKALLQVEVNEARLEMARLQKEFDDKKEGSTRLAGLLTEKINVNLHKAVTIDEVKKHYENIAGVEIPVFEEVTFHKVDYSLFETPAWVDGVILRLREMACLLVEIDVAKEKKEALEAELRNVSIRVNLFEKILIPRAETNIRKIKVFLGDQELSAVGQVKVAKTKIEERKNKRKQLEIEKAS